jgi:hypothetical protein
MLHELDQGQDNKFVRNKLFEDDIYRERYLVLVDFVDALVHAGYANMQVLVTTTREFYAPLFRLARLAVLQLIMRNTSSPLAGAVLRTRTCNSNGSSSATRTNRSSIR